jgi:2'-5' RNA ligase superfamily
LKNRHLYLFTLEVVPLTVGKVYNPLPSHLTLMSRFRSELLPDELAAVVEPLFGQNPPIKLRFDKSAGLGPKKTPVHLIEHTEELRELHTKLRNLLDTVSVTYEYPQFVGDNHKPHISKRQGDDFALGHEQTSKAAYLIEVEIKSEEHLRLIRAKFDLGR